MQCIYGNLAVKFNFELSKGSLARYLSAFKQLITKVCVMQKQNNHHVDMHIRRD